MEKKRFKLLLLLFSFVCLILLAGGSYYYFQVRKRVERTQARKTGERWWVSQAEERVLGEVSRYGVPIDPFKGHAFRYGRISEINREERTLVVDVGSGETVKVILPEGMTIRIEKEIPIGVELKDQDIHIKGSLLGLEKGDVVRIVGPSEDPVPLLQSEITAWALEVSQ